MSSGRKMVIKKGTVAIAAIQSKSMKIACDGIEITNDDSGGYRQYDVDAALKSMDVDFEGLLLSDVSNPIVDIGMNPTANRMLTDITITLVDLNIVYAGNFWFGEIELSGAHDDAIKFSGSLKSSGAFTMTNGANPT